MKRHHGSFRHLWAWPIVLGVLTSVGLVTALFSDGGVGDALAWVTLGIPVGVGAWYGWRRPRERVEKRAP